MFHRNKPGGSDAPMENKMKNKIVLTMMAAALLSATAAVALAKTEDVSAQFEQAIRDNMVLNTDELHRADHYYPVVSVIKADSQEVGLRNR